MNRAGSRLRFPGRDRPATRAFAVDHTERNAVLITMTAQITGTRNGEDWPAVGGTLDVTDDEATSLIAAGLAEAAPQPATRKSSKD